MKKSKDLFMEVEQTPASQSYLIEKLRDEELEWEEHEHSNVTLRQAIR